MLLEKVIMANKLDDSILVYFGGISLIILGVSELILGKAIPISLSGSIIEKAHYPIGFYLLSIGKILLGFTFLVLIRFIKRNKKGR